MHVPRTRPGEPTSQTQETTSVTTTARTIVCGDGAALWQPHLMREGWVASRARAGGPRTRARHLRKSSAERASHNRARNRASLRFRARASSRCRLNHRSKRVHAACPYVAFEARTCGLPMLCSVRPFNCLHAALPPTKPADVTKSNADTREHIDRSQTPSPQVFCRKSLPKCPPPRAARPHVAAPHTHTHTPEGRSKDSR